MSLAFANLHIQPARHELMQRWVASTLDIAITTWNAHWNVRGSNFAALHSMFEDQYKELFDAVDTVAEHARAQNIFVLIIASTVREHSLFGDYVTWDVQSSWQDMCRGLLRMHERMLEWIEEQMVVCEKKQETLDLLIERARVQRDFAWRLRMMVDGEK